MLPAAASITFLPTSVEPVNPIFATRGSVINAVAVVAPGPGSTLKVPFGQTRLHQDVGDREGGQRRLRRRLEDRRVPARERRGDLPVRDHRGEVPRADQRAGTDGLPKRHVEPRRDDRDRLPEDLVRRAAPVLVGVGDDVDLGAGSADRLAAVARLERRELLLAVADQERCLREHVAPLPSAHPTPRARFERVHRDVDALDERPRATLARPPTRVSRSTARSPRSSRRRPRPPVPRQHQQLCHLSLRRSSFAVSANPSGSVVPPRAGVTSPGDHTVASRTSARIRTATTPPAPRGTRGRP